MNWKNVLYLLRVERKSGRLVRGVKATKYKENQLTAYWPYWVAAIIGILGGLLANFIVGEIYADTEAAAILPPLNTAAVGFFVTLPTMVLLFSILLTMLQQIQLSGVKATTQVMYWLPITWKEQTLASILANLLGFPVAIAVGVTAGLLAFAALNGMFLFGWAIVTSLIMFAAAFVGSATTEIVRVLQTRFVGAVYKSSGKAAVWIRFAGSLIFFVIFYVLYFGITQGPNQFFQGLSSIQSSIWFVPFVWPALTLYYFIGNSIAYGALFLALSAAFIVALYLLAINLNERFGLYEPPAIKVQTSGAYAPKTGLLGRIGFSTIEAALIRKDIRAFTRRRELMGIFIMPIVFIILPISQSFGSGTQGVPQVSMMFTAMLFLFPASLMSMSLGNMLIGEEGTSVWRIYTSPITPKNYVKAKLTFLTAMAVLVTIITGIVAVLFYQPSIKIITAGFVEAICLIAAIGPIALSIGFKGADFTVSRRARMIRQEWALISLVVCALAGLAVLAPLIPYAISTFIPGFTLLSANSLTDLILPLAISGVIAAVISAIFYRIDIDSAKELFRKAEN
jgi:hypothetical protein